MSEDLADIQVFNPAATRWRRQGVHLLAAFLALAWAAVWAKGSQSVPQPQNEAARGLTSSRWEIRSGAVAHLAKVPSKSISAETRRTLINLLESETNALWDKLQGTSTRGYPPQGEGGEGWAEYYASLVSDVMKLHDPAATTAIVAASSGPGSSLNEHIAALGPTVVGVVCSRLHWFKSVRIREPGFDGVQYNAEMGMLDILARLVLVSRAGNAGRPLSASDLADIRAAAQPLLHSPSPWVPIYAARTLAIVGASQDQQRVQETFARLLKDPDHNRRNIALSALRDITDPRFLPVDQLRQVAEHDPFRLSGPGAGYPAGAYPLRQEAEQILQGLRPKE